MNKEVFKKIYGFCENEYKKIAKVCSVKSDIEELNSNQLKTLKSYSIYVLQAKEKTTEARAIKLLEEAKNKKTTEIKGKKMPNKKTVNTNNTNNTNSNINNQKELFLKKVQQKKEEKDKKYKKQFFLDSISNELEEAKKLGLSSQDMQKLIKEVFDFDVHESTIRRYLKRESQKSEV